MKRLDQKLAVVVRGRHICDVFGAIASAVAGNVVNGMMGSGGSNGGFMGGMLNTPTDANGNYVVNNGNSGGTLGGTLGGMMLSSGAANAQQNLLNKAGSSLDTLNGMAQNTGSKLIDPTIALSQQGLNNANRAMGFADQAAGLVPTALGYSQQAAQYAGQQAGIAPIALGYGNQAAGYAGQAAGYAGQAADYAGKEYGMAQHLTDTGQGLLDTWNKDFMPGTLATVNKAFNYDTPEREALEAGRASGAVQQSIDSARGDLQRQMAAYGVNPNSGRFLGLTNETNMQGAAQKAAAENQARLATENMGMQYGMQASQLGMGIGQMGMQGMQAGMQGMGLVNQGMGTAIQGMGVANQGMGVANQSLGMANQAYGNAMLGMGYANQGVGVANQALTNSLYGVNAANQGLNTSLQGMNIAGNMNNGAMNGLAQGITGATGLASSWGNLAQQRAANGTALGNAAGNILGNALNGAGQTNPEDTAAQQANQNWAWDPQYNTNDYNNVMNGSTEGNYGMIENPPGYAKGGLVHPMQRPPYGLAHPLANIAPYDGVPHLAAGGFLMPADPNDPNAPDQAGNGTPVDATGGGAVSGPGSQTSDSIPSQLSDGEYVLNAGAVKLLGPDGLAQLDQLNHAGLRLRSPQQVNAGPSDPSDVPDDGSITPANEAQADTPQDGSLVPPTAPAPVRMPKAKASRGSRPASNSNSGGRGLHNMPVNGLHLNRVKPTPKPSIRVQVPTGKGYAKGGKVKAKTMKGAC